MTTGHVRITSAELAEQREAIHAGHEDVGQQDVVGVGFQARERFFAVGALSASQRRAREHGVDEFMNGRVIVHDQEPVRLRSWHESLR